MKPPQPLCLWCLLLIGSAQCRLQAGTPLRPSDAEDGLVHEGEKDHSRSRRRLLGQEPVFLNDADEEVSVIIGVRNGSGFASVSNRTSAFHTTKLKKIGAISAKVKKSELEALYNDPNIAFVERDGKYYPSGEAVLYGLEMIQAFSPLIPKTSDSVSSSCSDPNSFKIGIIDAGLAV